jgi:predicted secreted Zn-dependent protease
VKSARITPLLSWLPLSLLWAAPSFADRNDFAIDYFDVHGASSRELDAEIAAKGPVGENGLRSDGYTRWHIDWRFDMTSDGTRCMAQNITVDLDIRMTLPRWERPRSASPALVERWDKYLAALRLHEDGHRYRAEAAAADVRRTLQRERTARDCRALEHRLNSLANSLLDELRRRQEDYDRETESGRRQGVRRP